MNLKGSTETDKQKFDIQFSEVCRLLWNHISLKCMFHNPWSAYSTITKHKNPHGLFLSLCTEVLRSFHATRDTLCRYLSCFKCSLHLTPNTQSTMFYNMYESLMGNKNPSGFLFLIKHTFNLSSISWWAIWISLGDPRMKNIFSPGGSSSSFLFTSTWAPDSSMMDLIVSPSLIWQQMKVKTWDKSFWETQQSNQKHSTRWPW